jgi:glutamate decarboxylase
MVATIQKDQRAGGKSFVSRTRFDMPQYDHQLCTVFRVVLANPLTTRQILSDILDEQREIAKTVLTRDGFAEKLAALIGSPTDERTLDRSKTATRSKP